MPPRMYNNRQRMLQRVWTISSLESSNRRGWKESVDRAKTVEAARRDLFEKALGDMEAERQLRQWREEGSLLRFE